MWDSDGPRLTQHVRRHSEQGVQQIMHLSISLHDISQLLVVHKLHVSPRVRGHALMDKESECMSKGKRET